MGTNKKNEDRIEMQKRFIIQVAYWAIIIAAGFFVFKYALPVLLPFLIAFLIAAILSKPIRYIAEKIHFKRSIVAIVLVILFFVFVGGLFTCLFMATLGGINHLFSFLPTTFENVVEPLIRDLFEKGELFFANADHSFVEMLDANAAALLEGLSNATIKLSNTILSWIAGVIAGVPSIFMKTVITIIVTFFMAIDFDLIENSIKKMIPEEKSSLVKEVQMFLGKTLPKFILSYSLILLMTFTELFVGLALLKIPYAGVIALLIAVLDILPVLGTGGILIPWAIISLLLGDYARGIGIAALYIVITIVRNTVEPKLIGKQMGLHPVVTLAAMLLGLHFFGIIGLFGMPMLLSFLKKITVKNQPKEEVK